mgnify:CR=1 FL=1
MQQRQAIALTEEERRNYIAAAMTVILVSIGRDGYPHAVPMWFTVEADGCFYMTTYGRSQKAVNLRRNPKAALLVESGVRYEELKGVLIRGTAEVIDDFELCVRILTRIHAKHHAGLAGDIAEVMRAQARKRVTLKVTPERVASWDHRKLGGVY